SVKVRVGDKVKVGDVLLTLSGSGAAPAAVAPSKPATQPAAKPAAPAPAPAAKPAPVAAAVGPRRVEVRMPSLAEGTDAATVVNVAVKPGDTVAENQLLFECQTEKANFELTSPAAARVEEVRAKIGDEVDVGSVMAVLTTEQAAPVPA